jgi:hypothetical protein
MHRVGVCTMSTNGMTATQHQLLHIVAACTRVALAAHLTCGRLDLGLGAIDCGAADAGTAA